MGYARADGVHVAVDCRLFGDIDNAPYHIGGTSKTGETYKMMISHTAGDLQMWNLQGASGFEDDSSKMYATSDARAASHTD